ncbi:MAG: hypothetical protein ABR498_06875 [Candidatus Dormibacteria bacterium]
MAVMLVENLSAHFDPERHHDEYREALIKVVDAKMANQPIEHRPEREPAKVTDLMAALKASVEAAQAGRRESEPAGTKRAARTERSRPPSSRSAEPARRRKAS